MPTTIAAGLAPGHSVCQRPIDVTADFDEIRMSTGGPVTAAPAINVEVLDSQTGRRLASGRTGTGGRPLDGVIHAEEVVARVGTVHAGQRVAVCLFTDGPRKQRRFSSVTPPWPRRARARSSTGAGGIPMWRWCSTGTESRSLLALAPDVVDRAALFHGSLSAPWLLWVLAALVVLRPTGAARVRAAGGARRRDQVRK